MVVTPDLDAVSIVIPHYGDPQPTLELIAQLQAQQGPVTVQLIVSDDASPEPFPSAAGVELVRRERNGGFGAAVNTGAKLAVHESLLILNSDLRLPANFLVELIAGAHPWWPAVVAPRVVHPHGAAIVSRHWPTVSQQMVEWFEPFARFHGRDWLERMLGNDVTAHRCEGPALTDWVLGVCMLLPVEDLRAIGGFDERYFMNCEEIDLQRRLHHERNLPVVLLPTPTLNHASGASSDPERRAGWLTDARFRYHEKWVGGPGLRRALTATTTANLVWGCARKVFGRGNRPVGNFARQRKLIAHGWTTRNGQESPDED
ncbi:glycosyltransferase family 2 protein [Calidifontibacter terrae]